MADNNGLSFVSSIDNAQLDAALTETMRKVQGFSDSFAAAGDTMDDTIAEMAQRFQDAKFGVETLENQYKELLASIASTPPGDAQNQLIAKSKEMEIALRAEKVACNELGQGLVLLQNVQAQSSDTTEQIATKTKQCNVAIDSHKNTIRDLQRQLGLYQSSLRNSHSLSEKDRAIITQKVDAINGEITLRKRLVQDLEENKTKLDQCAKAIEKQTQSIQNGANGMMSYRKEMRLLQMQLVEMEKNGLRGTEQYDEVRAKVAELCDAMSDARQQMTTLANDEAGFAGTMQGLTGLAGGFSAVTGAMGLFGMENENLQTIMMQTQSIMAVTNGLQQISQTFNKDSAFMLVTVTKAREWWNTVLAAGTAKEIANTAATTTNTGAQIANAASTGLMAKMSTWAATSNGFLAASIRMVSAAIKGIPVFGWIAAALGVLVGVISHFSSKASEAKKKAEEFYNSLADNCYKPITIIKDLSAQWNELGDNLEAKKKFIEDNKQKFEELGVSVQGVTDAENLLNKNKEAFINAQIEKAKALVYVQLAMEKQKEAIKKLGERDQESQTVVKLGWGGFYSPWQEKNKEYEQLCQATDDLLAQAKVHETNGWNALQEAGISATKTYDEGTLGAIEQAIRDKQEALKPLTNNDAYKEALEELAKLQDQANKITGNTTNQFRPTKTTSTKTTSKSSSDPFVENLNKRKSEYQRYLKWMQSGDAVLVASAKKEFEALLKQGATYIDYLKTQRDQILQVDVAKRTKAQNHQLRVLNNQIAEETKKTVLDTFNAELSEQLTNAKTTVEMLKVIEAKRKELANDGTELDNGKKESLDNAEKDVKDKERQELESLLNDYASYAEQKKRIEEQFNRDIETLNRARLAATTDAERQAIDDAIANRTKKKDTDVNNIGGVNYNDMLGEYGTFEQKKSQIHEEYEAKRRIAKEQNDTKLIERLNDAEAKAISKMASEELTGSDKWTQLFGDLDSLTAGQIDTLIKEIESKFDTLSGSFNPIDLATIRDKLKEARTVMIQDNPFKQMGADLKEVFKSGASDSKDSAQKIKRNWQNLGKSTEASFKFVSDAVNSCDLLKDAIGEVGATALSSLTAICSSAIAVSAAIKTAEKSSVVLAIIQAALVAVQAIYSVVKAIMGNNDKKIEKQINGWKSNVDDLKNAYAELSWQIDKALGGKTYEYQKKAIANMREQQALMKKMENAERSKKEKDDSKIKDYQEQQKELNRQIADMEQAIADDILQTTAKDFSQSLADALVSAFEKGEDAAKAFEQTVNDVLKQAIINQLKKKFLEQRLQDALNGLMDSMGYFQGETFVFDGLTDAEIAKFKNTVKNAGDNFNQALEIYSGIFKDIAGETADTALTGAVKGVSEETASIVAGQMNAIRINQMESAEILRQQLTMLNSIATNTSFNRHLAKLDRIVTLLEVRQSDSLRSQGLV